MPVINLNTTEYGECVICQRVGNCRVYRCNAGIPCGGYMLAHSNCVIDYFAHYTRLPRWAVGHTSRLGPLLYRIPCIYCRQLGICTNTPENVWQHESPLVVDILTEEDDGGFDIRQVMHPDNPVQVDHDINQDIFAGFPDSDYDIESDSDSAGDSDSDFEPGQPENLDGSEFL